MADAIHLRAGGAEYTFVEERELWLGSDETADVRLTNPSVSRRHGRLTRNDDGWQYEDVGSTNGTTYGDHRIRRLPLDRPVTLLLGEPGHGEEVHIRPERSSQVVERPLRVFISYARSDQPAVEQLGADIEAQGHRVWFDREIPGGHSWWSTILAEIRACDVFVIALSSASLQSLACRSEARYAMQLRRPILPVAIGDVPYQLLPRFIADIHHLDYRPRTPDSPAVLARALRSLPRAPELPVPLPPDPPAPGGRIHDLVELVDSQDMLTLEEQYDALQRLKVALLDERQRDSASELLKRLRSRPDIVYDVAHEIDVAIGASKAEYEPFGRAQLVWLYIGSLFTAGVLGIAVGATYMKNPLRRNNCIILLVMSVAWFLAFTFDAGPST